MCMTASDLKKNKKTTPLTIGQKNAVMSRIFNLVYTNQRFLLLGHTYADEDCIASLVALGLLLKKFKKDVVIYIGEPISTKLDFLLGICNYNHIKVLIGEFPKMEKFEVIFVMDTPKPDMIDVKGYGAELLQDPSIPKIEMDHHFNADAEYCGDEGYCLTMRASSTCEIIARICSKLKNYPLILKQYEITELYSRNIILAMLTGMIGDAKFGNYLFKRRDKAFYEYFLKKFNGMLNEKLYKNSRNISSIEEILETLETLSEEDSKIYSRIITKAEYSGKTGAVVLGKSESDMISKDVDYPQFVGLIKKATDSIAETAKGVGISVYFDPPDISDKIQFRIRASEHIKGIDLRPVLDDFKINDGGGHPGAIGFRFPASQVEDIKEYTKKIIQKVETLIKCHL